MTFESKKSENYVKAIDNWAASCKQLADGTLNINNSDGNLKIQPENPDGSIKLNLSDKIKSISKEFKKNGEYVRYGLIDAMAVSDAYERYRKKNDSELSRILHESMNDDIGVFEKMAGENIKMVVPTPNDTDEISRILHMSMDDTVDILDDMASKMDADMKCSSIDELKEKLPYLVALRKSINLINGLKHLIDDWEKPCR